MTNQVETKSINTKVIFVVSIIVVSLIALCVTFGYSSSFGKNVRAKLIISEYQNCNEKYDPQVYLTRLVELGAEIVPTLSDKVVLPENRGLDTISAKALFQLKPDQFTKSIVSLLKTENSDIQYSTSRFLRWNMRDNPSIVSVDIRQALLDIAKNSPNEQLMSLANQVIKANNPKDNKSPQQPTNPK